MTGSLSGIVTRDSSTLVSWHADTAIVLEPVHIEIGGVGVVIDAAFPDVVIDVIVDSTIVRSTRALFTEVDFTQRLSAAPDGARIDGPTLAESFARLATVRAVDRIHLGDLDEAALLLDQAFAHRKLGSFEPALRYYVLGATAAERLVDEIDNGDHSPATVRMLSSIIDSCPPDALDTPSRDRLAGILRTHLLADDIGWQTGLSRLIGQDELATSLGDFSTVTGQLNDLRPFPARALRFTGPDAPDLEITTTDGSISVRARLRDEVIPESQEIQETMAVAADSSTGEILAVAPCSASGGQISAELYPGTSDPSGLRFALISADTPLESIRLDPLGIAMTRIDRHCRYAWSLHREAGAILAGAGATTAESVLTRIQQNANRIGHERDEVVATVQGLTRQLARRTRNTPDTESVARYVDAVGSFVASLDGPPATDGPQGPTLTELLAVGNR
ncbi:hypothetical protein [Gordonia sp. (in: high G+C Gram-positive bacteria)]|jgi:hypothetical protein|uniref:hypothetical protein n=1 Tax=Gordonia sp. (in: high G+C Gram-positive bacteria) TaxID=84139 RepID=UPI001DDDE22D|nr:hypothetical protein [Gordonia sp. (in: high G+C Gram-positive bacteria)]MCB1294211.1 hypothetical protein [Gordonia sp. (in: high G+C Gram-positive bacteria)]HMS75895.1 hypothetical protein [Gordonia sp. (in: high G+C Gram-positive bacteria)]HQV17626.1 hypothetical protein [Gordonia sp. (in: high G+C Gram-positive bacteria)]